MSNEMTITELKDARHNLEERMRSFLDAAVKEFNWRLPPCASVTDVYVFLKDTSTIDGNQNTRVTDVELEVTLDRD